MKYKVNETCIGCGLCAATCPEAFSMGGSGLAVATEKEVSTELLASAEDAKNGCPLGAITEE